MVSLMSKSMSSVTRLKCIYYLTVLEAREEADLFTFFSSEQLKAYLEDNIIHRNIKYMF